MFYFMEEKGINLFLLIFTTMDEKVTKVVFFCCTFRKSFHEETPHWRYLYILPTYFYIKWHQVLYPFTNMTIMNHVADGGSDNILCCHFNDEMNVFFFPSPMNYVFFFSRTIKNITELFEQVNLSYSCYKEK